MNKEKKIMGKNNIKALIVVFLSFILMITSVSALESMTVEEFGQKAAEKGMTVIEYKTYLETIKEKLEAKADEKGMTLEEFIAHLKEVKILIKENAAKQNLTVEEYKIKLKANRAAFYERAKEKSMTVAEYKEELINKRQARIKKLADLEITKEEFKAKLEAIAEKKATATGVDLDTYKRDVTKEIYIKSLPKLTDEQKADVVEAIKEKNKSIREVVTTTNEEE
jgi:hypothetical protein